MKAVLLSIRPKWCDLIVRGEKTIEVRKTRPTIETPFKAYIYCTSVKNIKIQDYVEVHKATGGAVDDWSCKAIGEFTCNYIAPIFRAAAWIPGEPAKLYVRGAEGCCRKGYTDRLLQDACLNRVDIERYFGDLNGLAGYGWCISDLKIYDKPRELDEFSRFGFCGMNGTGVCGNEGCKYYEPSGNYMEPPTCAIYGCYLKRPPQSWCYVEAIGEEATLI